MSVMSHTHAFNGSICNMAVAHLTVDFCDFASTSTPIAQCHSTPGVEVHKVHKPSQNLSHNLLIGKWTGIFI